MLWHDSGASVITLQVYPLPIFGRESIIFVCHIDVGYLHVVSKVLIGYWLYCMWLSGWTLYFRSNCILLIPLLDILGAFRNVSIEIANIFDHNIKSVLFLHTNIVKHCCYVISLTTLTRPYETANYTPFLWHFCISDVRFEFLVKFFPRIHHKRNHFHNFTNS